MVCRWRLLVVDMSMLGKENEVVEADMDKINVVPNHTLFTLHTIEHLIA